MTKGVCFERGAAGRMAVLAALLSVIAVSGGTVVQSAPAADGPAEVTARYKLRFNGFDVGDFNFKSSFNGRTYTTTGGADVSALFGAFKWKGGMAANGALDGRTAKPAAYELNFKSKKKVGLIKLGFDAAGVSTVAVLPAKPPSPEAVPVKPEHLKNAIDPMTAILAMTYGAGKPCDKTVPVFDGKARFNLVMSYKATRQLEEKRPTGQPSQLIVCRVAYQPIAGHKPKDFENPWVSYGDIEMTLRPIPTARLYVPYQVSIATTIGAMVMQAESIDITGADNTVIALRQ